MRISNVKVVNKRLQRGTSKLALLLRLLIDFSLIVVVVADLLSLSIDIDVKEIDEL